MGGQKANKLKGKTESNSGREVYFKGGKKEFFKSEHCASGEQKTMKIKFFPKNIEADVDPNKSVLEIARELGLSIQSSCNGMCACGDCRVFLKEGEGHVFPPTDKEMELIGRGHYVDQRRLSCQLYCFGNVSVNLKEQEERNAHGKISRQFLERAQKKTPEEAKSLGGIFIQEDKYIGE